MLKSPAVEAVLIALAEPSRRQIVERLSRGPVPLSALAEPLQLTVAAIVQHVQHLERAGLVRSAKHGRVRTCQLEPNGFKPLERWIADRRALWDRRLDRLGALLDAD